MHLGPLRNRLFLLFAGGLISGLIAASVGGQSTVANQPPGVSVLAQRWEKHTSNGMMYSPQATPTPVGQVDDGDPRLGAVNWPSGSSYFYYIQLRNEGPKVIKSTALDYVFTDPESKAELARRPLVNFQKVELNKTKWLEIRGVSSGPPKIATVEGIKKNQRAPFDEHVEIKCVLYTDGTGWKPPEAEAKRCDTLVKLTQYHDGRRQ